MKRAVIGVIVGYIAWSVLWLGGNAALALTFAEPGDTLDTGTPQLLGRVEDRVAVLTLNRPEARNALSDELSPALRRMIADLALDPEVGCVVITGAGSSFCAGGDIKGMGGGRKPASAGPPDPDKAAANLLERQLALTGALYEMPQPTIAGTRFSRHFRSRCR